MPRKSVSDWPEETTPEPTPPPKKVAKLHPLFTTLVGKRLTNFEVDDDKLIELVFDDGTRLKFDRVKLL